MFHNLMGFKFDFPPFSGPRHSWSGPTDCRIRRLCPEIRLPRGRNHLPAHPVILFQISIMMLAVV